MANNTNKPKEYGAGSIRVMEGLEAVRKRPAMYIGSTGPQGLHHLVYEVVDNSVDEALAGQCDTINIILHDNGSCSVEDNGRGIPTDIHPTEKVSAAQVVLTKLHAGGKFDKDAYKFSGGLHGVGVSVVNALSEWLEVTIFRDGKIYTQSYQRGKPRGPLEIVGETKKRGTIISFQPDAEIFTETTAFSFDTLSARLRELAFLNKKLRITITDEQTNKSHEFYFEGGIVSFVEHINKKKTPLFSEILHLETHDDKHILEMALQYNNGYGEQLFSFVNNINTIEGGTHVAGFRSALTKVCNKKAQSFGTLKEGVSFSSEDVREGLVCVMSIKIPEPQFEGQTKTKLGNNEIKGLVDSWIFSFLDTYFEEHPTVARKILQKAEVAMHAREAAKRARELTRRKTVFETTILPGKLADCTLEDPSKTELFIVEGDSAGGSAKQGRDRINQAILPLKGKILNVEKARIDRILANDEIKALIAAIGCGIEKEFDINKARYHKIILMTDADVDGAHIRTLLLTFFFRYMQPLIEKGYLFISQPPLYKVKIGKVEQYLKDDKAFKQFLFDWATEHTQVTSNKKIYEPSEWKTLLTQLQEYDAHLLYARAYFRISYDQCHRLIHALHTNPWTKQDGTEKLLTILRKQLTDFDISIEQSDEERNEEEKHTVNNIFVIFAQLNVQSSVPLSFFAASETKKLLTLIEPLSHIEQHTWELHVIDKERKMTGTGILSLIDAILTISKPYMNIQRYKGLGEMNAEQLWETSMDSRTRNLLKVTIEDALEADRWFTTLMGDDVTERKKYIEQYGHFVKNLDV